MIELISNSRNNNGIAVYLQQDHRNVRKIIKTSYTAKGIADLLRERDGWTWYYENKLCSGLSLNCVASALRESFVRIDIGFIDGQAFDYTLPIERNLGILDRCITWYIENWPYNGNHLGPIHGDFSLGNLIDSNGRLVLIDWEHFAADRAPWGVDVVALVLETIYFSRSRWSGLRDRDIVPTKPLFQRLAATGRLEPRFVKNPLAALRAFIRGASDIWGDQVSKLPVLHYTDEEVALIDRILAQYQTDHHAEPFQ